jgi:glutamate N-acetyltransferase/amino-acid N-acetyltransferase
VDESFNSISVDGECSTNDAVLLLANGAAGAPRDDEAFVETLKRVCADLAAQIVADGEGATLTAEIRVSGARNTVQAKAIARRVATSTLVKTALFGRDANWGRILAAAGSAPYNGGYAELDPNAVSLRVNEIPVLEAGAPLGAEPDLAGSSCRIDLDLGLGAGEAAYLTSDLSYDYVRINAEYRT